MMFRKAGTTRVNIYYPWALWNNYYSNQKEGVSLSCKYFFEKVHTRNQIMDLKEFGAKLDPDSVAAFYGFLWMSYSIGLGSGLIVFSKLDPNQYIYIYIYIAQSLKPFGFRSRFRLIFKLDSDLDSDLTWFGFYF